ncbi:MAG: TorF family putative porin, partial [Burkholderiaceae bacterium]
MNKFVTAAGTGLVLTLLSTVVSTAFAQTTAPAAAAETAPAAPAPGTTFGPDLTLTGNAGLFSDYRFRGFTQTGYKPAFQGGFDLS